MKTLTLAALAAVVLSTPAFAQTESAPPMIEADGAPTAASAARLDGTRVRFGIGSYSSVSSAGTTSIGVLGISVQLGVQLNDEWAVYAMAQGSTAVVQNTGNLSLMVERELFGHLSVAVGGRIQQSVSEYMGDFGTGAGGGSYTATSVAVPVRVAVNMGFLNPSSLFQKRFTIALEGAAGTVLESGGSHAADTNSRLALSAGMSFGFSLM